jgi:hypothetical protein
MISVVGGNSFKEVKRIEYTVFSEILGYGRVVHTPMEGIRVVPCNQQKDCTLKITLFLRFSFSCKIKNSSTNHVLTCPA